MWNSGLHVVLLVMLACGDSSEDQASNDAHQHDHENTDLPETFNPATEHSSNTGVTISYTTDPSPIPESTEFAITFTVTDGTLIEADATMPTHGGHGMPVAPALTDNEDGTYTAAPFEFPMPGYWVIHAVVADDSGTEERVDFEVDCCE